MGADTAMAPMKAMKSKAMKAMKAKAQKTGKTASEIYQAVADASGVKRKDVKSTVDTYMEICASELKKTGSFKIGQNLKLKLKVKPATCSQGSESVYQRALCLQ